MLPTNLSSFTNEELVKFIWDNPDPLIQELCTRLEGINFNRDVRIQELNGELEIANEEIDNLKFEVDGGNERIELLEGLLEENKIEIPA